MTGNAVLEGDCAMLLRSLESESVDFVLTDPPYLAHYLDRTGRTVKNDDRAAWLYPCFAEVYRVLKDGHFCASFYGWPQVDRFMSVWRTVGFRPVGHIIWRKRYPSAQHFLAYHHEQAFLLAKGNPPRPEPEKALSDVLEWSYTGNRLHPTQKPVGALMPLVRAFSAKGELVLDPFCGSGSCLVAAQYLGRRYLGIEIDPAYADTARQRLVSERLTLAEVK
jgi:adenine-specific DNA-methyltransferase